MPNFAFRISLPYGECSEKVLEYLEPLSDKLVIYEHEADDDVSRTHIHGLIMDCSRSDDTLRNNLFKVNYTKNYELKSTYKTKNGVYPVDAKYITYMSKGHLDPKYCKGFTEEEIAAYKAQWKDMKINKFGRIELTPKEEGKPKAMSRFAFVMHCAEIYAEEILKLAEEGHVQRMPYNRRLATQLVILECVKQQQAIGFYKIVDIVDAIQMVANPQGLANNILDYLDARDKKSQINN